MINKVVIIIFMSYHLVAQVVPYQIPYNIDDSSVWQKTYNFELDKRVVVKFDSNNCFDELFLINAKREFSGPYDSRIVNKTNPFKAKDLTIQVLSSGKCDMDNQIFIIEDYQDDIVRSDISKSYSEQRENPVILITGYWPPTNEMIRDFSQNPDLNPTGWIGDDWESRGYDVVSFFPESFDVRHFL